MCSSVLPTLRDVFALKDYLITKIANALVEKGFDGSIPNLQFGPCSVTSKLVNVLRGVGDCPDIEVLSFICYYLLVIFLFSYVIIDELN